MINSLKFKQILIKNLSEFSLSFWIGLILIAIFISLALISFFWTLLPCPGFFFCIFAHNCTEVLEHVFFCSNRFVSLDRHQNTLIPYSVKPDVEVWRCNAVCSVRVEVGVYAVSK